MHADIVLKQIICNLITSLKNGEHQFSQYGSGPKPDKIIIFRFDLKQDYHVENGNQYIELIAWPKSNYITIMCREKWDVIIRKSRVRERKTGTGELTVLANHDDCWRDGVARFFQAFEKGIIGLYIGTIFGNFYEVRDIGEEEQEEYREAIRVYDRARRNFSGPSFEVTVRDRFDNLEELIRLRELNDHE